MTIIKILFAIICVSSHLFAGQLLVQPGGKLDLTSITTHGGMASITDTTNSVIGQVYFDLDNKNLVIRLDDTAPENLRISGLPDGFAGLSITETKKTIIFTQPVRLTFGAAIDTLKACHFDQGIETPHLSLIKGTIHNSGNSTIDVIQGPDSHQVSLIHKSGNFVVRQVMTGGFDRLHILAPMTCQGLMQVKTADCRLESLLTVNTLILEKTGAAFTFSRAGKIDVKRHLFLLGASNANLNGNINFHYDVKQLAQWEKGLPHQLKQNLSRHQAGITMQFPNGQILNKSVTTMTNGSLNLQAKSFTDKDGFTALSVVPGTLNTLMAQTQKWLGTLVVNSDLRAMGQKLIMDSHRTGDGTVIAQFGESIFQETTDRDTIKRTIVQAPEIDLLGHNHGDLRQAQGENIRVGSRNTNVKALDVRATQTYEELPGTNIQATEQSYKEGGQKVIIGNGAVTDSPTSVTKSGGTMDLHGKNTGSTAHFSAEGNLHKGATYDVRTTNLNEQARSFTQDDGATIRLDGGYYAQEATSGNLEASSVDGAEVLSFKAPNGKISIDGNVGKTKTLVVESGKGVDLNQTLELYETLYIKTGGKLARRASAHAKNISIIANGGIYEHWLTKFSASENLYMEGSWRVSMPLSRTSAAYSRFDIDWLNLGLLNRDAANTLNINTFCQLGLGNWIAGHDRLTLNSVVAGNLGALQSSDAHMNVGINVAPTLVMPSFSGSRKFGEAIASWSQSAATNAAVTLLPAPISLTVRGGLMIFNAKDIYHKVVNFCSGWDHVNRPANYFQKFGELLEIASSTARLAKQAKGLESTIDSASDKGNKSSFGWSDAWQIAGDPFARMILPSYTENSLWHLGNPVGIGLTGYSTVNSLRYDGVSLWDVSFSRDVMMGWGNDATNTINVFDYTYAFGDLILGGTRRCATHFNTQSDGALVLDRNLNVVAGDAIFRGHTVHAQKGAKADATNGDVVLDGDMGSLNEGDLSASGKTIVKSDHGDATSSGQMLGKKGNTVYAEEGTATGNGRMVGEENTVSGQHLRTTQNFVSEADKTYLVGQESFEARGVVKGLNGKKGELYAQGIKANVDVNGLHIEDLNQATFQAGEFVFQDPRPQPEKKEEDTAEDTKQPEEQTPPSTEPQAPPTPPQETGVALKLDLGIENGAPITKEHLQKLFDERYGVKLNDNDAQELAKHVNNYISHSESGAKTKKDLKKINKILKRSGAKAFNPETELKKITRDIPEEKTNPADQKPDSVFTDETSKPIENREETVLPTHTVHHDGLTSRNVDKITIIGKGENLMNAVLGVGSYAGTASTPSLSVITDGQYDLDLRKLNEALKELNFWAASMNVLQGYTGTGKKDAGLQKMSLYALTGELAFAPGGSITGLESLDIYGETGIRTGHSVTKTFWTDKHAKDEFKTVTFDRVTLSADKLSIGTMGKFMGEAAVLSATNGDLYLWANQGYENLGYSEVYLKNYTKTGKRRTYDWDTAFCAGSLNATNGFVFTSTPNGGFLHKGGKIHGDKGVVFDIQDHIRLEGLLGKQTHYSIYRHWFKPLNMLHPDRLRWEEIEDVPTITLGENGFLAMRSQDNKTIFLHADMTSLGKNYVELNSQDVQFYRSILQKGSKTIRWKFSLNWNPLRGCGIFDGLKMIGKCLKDLAKGNLGDALSRLPTTDARLVRETHTRTSEFLGEGGLVAGCLYLSAEGANVIQHNAFNAQIGALYNNTMGTWTVNGATLHTRDTTKSSGLYVRVGYNGQSVDASAGICADHSKTKSIQQVVGQTYIGYAEMPSELNLNNGYFYVSEGTGHVNKVSAHTGQNSVETKAAGASIGVNPAGTVSGEAHILYDIRTQNITEPTGLHVGRGSVTVGEATLQGAKITGPGVSVDQTIVIEQPRERNFGVNVGLSFTANQATGQPSQPMRATFGGRLGDHRFSVSTNLWTTNDESALGQIGLNYGYKDYTYLNDTLSRILDPETYTQIYGDYREAGASFFDAAMSSAEVLSDRVAEVWQQWIPMEPEVDAVHGQPQAEYPSEHHDGEIEPGFLHPAVHILPENHGHSGIRTPLQAEVSAAEALALAETLDPTKTPSKPSASDLESVSEVHLKDEPTIPQPNEPLPKSGSGFVGRVEELETPFEFNGRQFKYRISGTPYLLEDAASYDAIMKAHGDIHSSPSVFAKEATNTLKNQKNIVFVYNSPTIPGANAYGCCGFDNSLVSTEIRSSSGCFTPNSKYIELGQGNSLLETLGHEATHSWIHSKYGNFLLGYSNSSIITDASFIKQHGAWLSDLNNIKGINFRDLNLLWKGPASYWEPTFRNHLGLNTQSNAALDNLVQYYGNEFMKGRSIPSLIKSNPTMGLSQIDVAAFKAGYMTMCEVPAWSAQIDILYPGLIREVQPKLYDLYRQLYFDNISIKYLRTSPVIDVPMHQMPVCMLSESSVKPWSWWGLTKPLGIGGLALWGGVHCYNEGRELGFSPVKSVVWSGSRVGTEFALFEANYAIPYVGPACMLFDLATLPFVFIPVPNWDKPGPVEHKILQAQVLYEDRQQNMPWWQRFFNANEIEMGPRDLANIPLAVQTAVHYRHTPIEVVSKYVSGTVVNASWHPPVPITQPQSFPWDDQRRRQLQDQ